MNSTYCLPAIPILEIIDMHDSNTLETGLLVWIYANGDNCSNGGISSRCTLAVLVEFDGRPVKGNSTPSPKTPAIRIVERWRGTPQEYLHAEPLKLGEGNGPMFGGTYVCSSDSRFRQLSKYPVALHDRWESYPNPGGTP